MGEHPLFVLPEFAVNEFAVKIDSAHIDKVTGEFHNGGNGVLTKNTEVQCFIASSKARPGWPDIWIVNHVWPSVDGRESPIFYTFIGRPRSKGTVTMDAEKFKAGVRDDQQLALIDYRFLADPDDVEILLEGKLTEFSFQI